jgi:Na+/phosphate symporter
MSYDADLNGSEDDDSDVSSTLEDGQSNSIEIELNQNHIQKVRIALKNTSGEVVENYTFKIIKNYLAEEIDISQVEFKGVSDSEKIKIEKLKDYVNALPKQYKLKALMYVQKLQEEWFDEREKTNVILEFE